MFPLSLVQLFLYIYIYVSYCNLLLESCKLLVCFSEMEKLNPSCLPIVQLRRIIVPNNCGEKLIGILHEAGSVELVIICHGFRSSKVQIFWTTSEVFLNLVAVYMGLQLLLFCSCS